MSHVSCYLLLEINLVEISGKFSRNQGGGCWKVLSRNQGVGHWKDVFRPRSHKHQHPGLRMLLMTVLRPNYRNRQNSGWVGGCGAWPN